MAKGKTKAKKEKKIKASDVKTQWVCVTELYDTKIVREEEKFDMSAVGHYRFVKLPKQLIVSETVPLDTRVLWARDVAKGKRRNYYTVKKVLPPSPSVYVYSFLIADADFKTKLVLDDEICLEFQKQRQQ